MHIVVTEAGRPPIEFRTDATEVILGRSPSCDVVVERPFISGRHLRILAGSVVHDLGSTNGTFLDGRYLERPEHVGSKQLTIGGFDVAVRLFADASTAVPPRAAAPGETSGGHAAGAILAPAPAVDASWAEIESTGELTALGSPDQPVLVELQMQRLGARVDELESELAGARARESAFASVRPSGTDARDAASQPAARPSPPVDSTSSSESPLLLGLVRAVCDLEPPRLTGTVTDFYTLESLRFICDVEAVVSPTPGETGRGLSRATRTDGGFARLLADAAARPDDPRGRESLICYLDELRRRLADF